MVKLKWRDLDTHAAFLSWDSEYSEGAARMEFVLPGNFSAGSEGRQLTMSLAEGNSDTKPKGWEEPDDKNGGNNTQDEAIDEDDDDKEEKIPLDWSIVLIDRNGARASLPLSQNQLLYPQVQGKPKRADFLEDDDTSEVLFRHYAFPLVDFVASNPQFDGRALAKISFVFDQSAKGSIIIDDIGISPALQ